MKFGDNRYGEVKYGEKIEEKINSENLNLDLMKYLPDFIRQSNIMVTLQKNIFSSELGKLRTCTRELLDQCFIDTASWGLELWEEFLGIPVDSLKPNENRRAVIKAKLRGKGTVTKTLIKQVACAYSGGEVEIIEVPDRYNFIIKFTGVRGIPPNMIDLTKTIEEIKPAHLSFEYQYTYSLWEWSKQCNWEKAKKLTWQTIRTNLKPLI